MWLRTRQKLFARWLNFRRRFKRSRIKRIFLEQTPRFVIIAKLNGRRDVAQFGSAPALGAGCRRFESCRPDQSRVWFNGRTEAFQASNAGSIPVTRSIKTPGQSLMSSDLFCLCAKLCATWGPNWDQARKTFQSLLSACHNKFCITQLFGYVPFRLVLSRSVANRQNPRCALRRGVGASRR